MLVFWVFNVNHLSDYGGQSRSDVLAYCPRAYVYDPCMLALSYHLYSMGNRLHMARVYARSLRFNNNHSIGRRRPLRGREMAIPRGCCCCYYDLLVRTWLASAQQALHTLIVQWHRNGWTIHHHRMATIMHSTQALPTNQHGEMVRRGSIQSLSFQLFDDSLFDLAANHQSSCCCCCVGHWPALNMIGITQSTHYVHNLTPCHSVVVGVGEDVPARVWRKQSCWARTLVLPSIQLQLIACNDHPVPSAHLRALTNLDPLFHSTMFHFENPMNGMNANEHILDQHFQWNHSIVAIYHVQECTSSPWGITQTRCCWSSWSLRARHKQWLIELLIEIKFMPMLNANGYKDWASSHKCRMSITKWDSVPLVRRDWSSKHGQLNKWNMARLSAWRNWSTAEACTTSIDTWFLIVFSTSD